MDLRFRTTTRSRAVMLKYRGARLPAQWREKQTWFRGDHHYRRTKLSPIKGT